MEPVRLTQFSPGAGCGCKISPAQLRQILQESLPGSSKKDQEGKDHSTREQRAKGTGLEKGTGDQRAAMVDRSNGAIEFPQLLVGYESCDDAAVYDIGGGKAVISTTDFFTPIVDDPYDYGAIAAANSLSDVYAMGGTPLLALNIAALPGNLPLEMTREIIRGGAEKAKEAGVVIAGGHSVVDQEPKFGLVVIGMVEIEKLLT